MSEFNPRLVADDLDMHVADLIDLGENPHTERFWDYLRFAIASLAETPERLVLVHWWIRRKKQYMGD